jgi:hypothetical protein
MAKQEIYAQIGVTALRDPVTGGFLPAIPLYVKVSPDEVNGKTGFTHAEEAALRDVGNIFADKMKQYIEAGGEIKRQGRRKKV